MFLLMLKDSESSYQVIVICDSFFATAPLPVVFISDFCCCFSIAALIILIQSKWLEMKSSFDVERYKRHEGHGWTRVICTRGCGIANKLFQPYWLWPGDAILLEKVGKIFFGFDILSSKIIYTPCRKVEKSSWFYFPFHFAFSLCLAPFARESLIN